MATDATGTAGAGAPVRLYPPGADPKLERCPQRAAALREHRPLREPSRRFCALGGECQPARQQRTGLRADKLRSNACLVARSRVSIAVALQPKTLWAQSHRTRARASATSARRFRVRCNAFERESLYAVPCRTAKALCRLERHRTRVAAFPERSRTLRSPGATYAGCRCALFWCTGSFRTGDHLHRTQPACQSHCPQPYCAWHCTRPQCRHLYGTFPPYRGKHPGRVEDGGGLSSLRSRLSARTAQLFAGRFASTTAALAKRACVGVPCLYRKRAFDGC